MKVSDFIVEYIIKQNITDVFGYPGGMVTHLMDSLSKYPIRSHITYHEQGAAFAACGYAQESGKVGVAYATSGPGATNLITGICNAYFDSIPTLFITGQVNSFEGKGEYGVRQRGFQETDIVSIVKPITKYAVKIEKVEKIKWYLDYAFYKVQEGRKGPVLLDIPMNIFREDVDPDSMSGYEYKTEDTVINLDEVVTALFTSNRPVIIAGGGIKTGNAVTEFRNTINHLNIPVVTTMLAVDVPEKSYGFIGAYGSRTANFIVAKSDLVITIGARLDVRQVGAKRDNFAPNAKIIRIDIDEGELSLRVHENEIQIKADVKDALEYLTKVPPKDYSKWISICNEIERLIGNRDDKLPNLLVRNISKYIPDKAIITTDVGQNQVWIAQSFSTKKNQRIFFSGGHGAMGYSLPAAIGCALASGRTVYSFSGDGGIQMNIQELQTVVRERLPIKIIVFNNSALGMIRHFQEMYFNSNYVQTGPDGGYTVPNFEKIANAYGLQYKAVENIDDISEDIFGSSEPQFIEVKINEPTYVFPKLEFGKPNQDQEPLLDRKMYEEIMAL